MGNRIQGFFAGAALTGFLATTTVGYMRSLNTVNSKLLRDTQDIITTRILSDRNSEDELAPLNRRVLWSTRPSVWETCKDIWNEEIITAANWVYSINWYQFGLDIDRKLNKLTDKVVLVAEKK